jgi:DNA-binding response OmpR family regulator
MKILVIEDEIQLAESIIGYFNSNDFSCEHASTLDIALEKVNAFSYDCILLDLMLENKDGFQLLKHLKKMNKGEAVIIISAKESLETKIEGLQIGADDYLVKPFHLSELLVRVQALIRRKNFSGKNIVEFNELTIDLFSKTVFVGENILDLTRKELDLLLFLIGNKGKVLSKGEIAEHLSGDMADMLDNHDFVYAHIKNLKKKLNEKTAQDYIKTIYGLGYKWQS